MRWFFIWIISLPLGVFAQSNFVKIDTIKGCDCRNVSTSNLHLVEEIINTAQVSNTLTACYFHCLGVFYYNDYNFLESIKNHEDALALRKKHHREFVWKSYYGLGLVYNDLGMYQKSQSFLQTAYVTEGVKRTVDSIEMLRIMANNLFEVGELRQAENYAIQAAQIETDKLWLTADASNNLAEILGREEQNKDNKKRAIEYADMTVSLYRESGEEEYYIAQALNNKAVALSNLGRYDEAIKTYKLVLNIYDEDTEPYAETLSNMGSDLSKKGDHSLAKKALVQSLKIKRDLYQKTYAYTYAPEHENLAENYDALGDMYKTLKHYQLALINLTDNFRNEDINTTPKVKDNYYVYNKPYLLQALDLKAQAALKSGNTDLAHSTYQELDAWINEFYKDLSTNQSKLTWIARAHDMYSHAIKVALEKNDKEKAFQYAEKARAVLLWQSHSQQAALSLLNDEERENYDDLLAQIRQADYNYRDAADKEKGELKRKLDSLNREFDQFEKILSDSTPEYAQRKYQPKNISLKDVQRNMLNDSTALLEYHWSADDMLYIFTLTKNDIYVDNIQLDSTFHSQIQEFYTEIGNDGDFSKFVTPGYPIYQTAFEPILKHLPNNIKKITLLPDGKLNYIPFEALPTKNDVANVHYLMDDYLFNYRYSCGNYSDSKVSDAIHTTLYVAPEFDGKNNLPQLKNPKISKHLNYGKLIKLTEKKPTKENVTREIFDADLVHFHTHAEQGRKGTGKIHLYDGGELTQDEIQGLELKPPRHAVLSACETGMGDLSKGEGVLSLGWSFVYRGVPSVVISLWKVNEKSTGELMKNYYQLLKKYPADEALQKAKIKLREQGKHPYHWSAFIHTGNPPTLHFTQNLSKYLYMAGIFLTIFLLLIYGIKRATKR